METKAGIGPNPKLADSRRHVHEAGRHQFDAAIPGARVAGTQFGIPEVGRVGLDAEQGVLRALATIPGIVADGRILLTFEHRDHTAVEIKDQTRSVAWEMDELLQQSVIHLQIGRAHV